MTRLDVIIHIVSIVRSRSIILCFSGVKSDSPVSPAVCSGVIGLVVGVGIGIGMGALIFDRYF